MEKLRKFVRWMLIDPDRPDIALAQYDELKLQIPALYALLMVNAVAVAYTHFDVAPLYLTVGVLVPMLVLTTGRMLSWLRAGRITLEADEAIAKMRRTVLLGSLMAVIYISWSLALDGYGGPLERGHVALFIAITVIGCIFCLMHLPQAAIMVMVIVTIPFMVYYISLNEDVFVAIALNIFLVCLVVLQVLLNGYRGFSKLVETQKETERLNLENARLAQTDALTGLPNRRYFFRRLDQEIGERSAAGSGFTIGVLDLDRFKPVNDTYGHKLGDQLLQAVGERLAKHCGADLDVCRLGGDEFGFLFFGPQHRTAQIGQALCDSFHAPFRIGDITVSVGASCGVAQFPDAGTSAHVLFDRADYALYASKSDARGRVTVYSSDHEAIIDASRAIETAFQGADLEEEFELHYQPIVSMSGREIIGFEALARWTSPVLGSVPPDTFVPIAERIGLIEKLTACLFRKAVADIGRVPDHLGLSFNLSAQDISSPKSVEALIAIIEASAIAPRRITFELTETAVIDSFDAAKSGLERLRTAGMALALDDFGTGYSSLGYLHRLPIDRIKVNKSFVTSLHEPSARGIVISILNLCRTMHLSCVAEGIETEDQVAALRELGCELAQGYHYGRPAPLKDVLEGLGKTGLIAGQTLQPLPDPGPVPARTN